MNVVLVLKLNIAMLLVMEVHLVRQLAVDFCGTSSVLTNAENKETTGHTTRIIGFDE